MTSMRNLRIWLNALMLVAATALLAPGSAHAQFSDSFNFLKGVRERDGNVVNKLLAENATTLVNTRDKSNGETGLIIAVRRQDAVWTKFLLGKGANPNLADFQGITPLMHATMLGFAEGADTLLGRGAVVDQTNKRGETALILAVQTRNPTMVRLLIAKGANPDRADHVAGLTARDYARRDDRTGALLALLDAKPADSKMPTGPIFGPK